MAINQLFLKEPSKEILLEIFNYLGYQSFTDNKSFSQKTINNVYDKIIPLNSLKNIIYHVKQIFILIL